MGTLLDVLAIVAEQVNDATPSPSPMWLVMNIGCIECGVSSKIVGVFSDKAKADEVATACDQTHSWREGGQNSFEVFEMPEPEVVDKEYSNT